MKQDEIEFIIKPAISDAGLHGYKLYRFIRHVKNCKGFLMGSIMSWHEHVLVSEYVYKDKEEAAQAAKYLGGILLEEIPEPPPYLKGFEEEEKPL